MEINAHDIMIERARLRYLVGMPEGEVRRSIVMLHGWRSDSSVWMSLMQALDDGETRMIAPDLPGFGNSEPPIRPEGVAGYREIIEHVMDRLSLHGAVVLGHSFGGSIAATLAAVRPELVSRLVLIDSAGIREDTSDKRLKRTVARMVRPLFRPAFMQPMRRRIYAAMGAGDYVARPDMQEHFRRIVAEDISSFFEQIQQPTLLLWGENDEDTPLEDGKRMHEAIGPSELVVLEDAGHFSFLDDAPEAVAQIQSFIGQRET